MCQLESKSLLVSPSRIARHFYANFCQWCYLLYGKPYQVYSRILLALKQQLGYIFIISLLFNFLYRNSHHRCSMRKGVLRNFSNLLQGFPHILFHYSRRQFLHLVYLEIDKKVLQLPYFRSFHCETVDFIKKGGFSTCLTASIDNAHRTQLFLRKDLL